MARTLLGFMVPHGAKQAATICFNLFERYLLIFCFPLTTVIWWDCVAYKMTLYVARFIHHAGFSAKLSINVAKNVEEYSFIRKYVKIQLAYFENHLNSSCTLLDFVLRGRKTRIIIWKCETGSCKGCQTSLISNFVTRNTHSNANQFKPHELLYFECII